MKVLVLFIVLLTFISLSLAEDNIIEDTNTKPSNKHLHGDVEQDDDSGIEYECPANSHYDECGKNCRPSCAKIWNDIYEECSSDCVEGCFCDEGYLYDEVQQACVEPDDCVKIECKRNEYFSECGNNCRKICKGLESDGCEEKDMCQVGCFCEDGYLFDQNTNTCISPEKCVTSCEPNAEYSDCVPACPDSCENWAMMKKDPSCSSECTKGCACKLGFLRESANSTRCIKKEECQLASKCGPNEQFSQEGNDCLNCLNYKFTVCQKLKVPGCYCKHGFVRHITEECISDKQCPDIVCQETDPNSVATDCAVCLPSCQKQEYFPCPPVCTAGCACKTGYIKDEISNRCVTMEQCVAILRQMQSQEEEIRKRQLEEKAKENQKTVLEEKETLNNTDTQQKMEKEKKSKPKEDL